MKRFIIPSLLASQLLGGIMTVSLFFICFFSVITAKLVYLGYLHVRANNKKPTSTEEKPKEKKVDPIYYIVEKKKKPPRKTEYAKPKRIDLVEEDELVH